MLNAFRRSCVQDVLQAVLPAFSLPALLLVGFFGIASISTAHAQATADKPTTPLERQLAHFDLGISGADFITKGVSGPNYVGAPVTLNTSSTLGAIVQIRYVRAPLIGFEFNYGYARYTENFNFATATPFGPPAGPFPVQTQNNEYTIGYVAHVTRLNYHGIQPFIAVGAGSTAFKPTTGGGEGLPEKARATYYYALGAEDMINPHFGLRLQFRQLFYKDPDFGQNYLTIQQQTITSQPTFGFYLKY